MTPLELKNSILQLAIQGKLVEQREEEGTGEELYQQIQVEKQKLIKEGKIKKEKPLPEITEEEITFDIPESWKWVHLSDVIDVRDGTHDTPKYVKEGVPLVTSKNLAKGFIDFTTAKMISIKDAEAINIRSGVDDGDILFAMIGTIGNPVLVKKDREFSIKNMALFKVIESDLFDMRFLLMFLHKAQTDMRKDANASVQSFISLSYLRSYPIPLPPLDEQKRIVTKIEELLPYIERYEEAWSKLENFNERFPEDMQKSLLQYAIQGKLVEQREEEGTGEELYQQIQKEKAKLIKEGKIKKEKPLPEITENEIPFDIPESWKWVHLNQIATSSLGKTLDKAKNTGDMCPYLCSINVYWSGINLEKIKEARFTEDDKKKYLLQKGDLLICEGGDVGRSSVWEEDIEMYYQNALHRVRFNGELEPYYFKYLLEFYKAAGILDEYSKGMTIKHLVQSALHSMWLPLPPLAEQKRIVAKLEELLPLCDRLK